MRRSLCKTTGIVAAAAFAAGPTELTEERLTAAAAAHAVLHMVLGAWRRRRDGDGGVRNFETSAQSAFTSSSFRQCRHGTARTITKCRAVEGPAAAAAGLAGLAGLAVSCYVAKPSSLQVPLASFRETL